MIVVEYRFLPQNVGCLFTFILGGVRFSWRMQSRQGYRLIRIRPTMETYQRELLNVSRIRRVDIDFQESRRKEPGRSQTFASRKIIRKRSIRRYSKFWFHLNSVNIFPCGNFKKYFNFALRTKYEKLLVSYYISRKKWKKDKDKKCKENCGVSNES